MSRLALALAAFLVASVALSQDFPLQPVPSTVEGHKMDTAPVIDGTVNPQEWAEAATLARSLVLVETGQPTGDKGQFWIGYDDKYVYFAQRITFAGKGKVKADEFRDNVKLGGDDQVNLRLDLYGTSQFFNNFAFNAQGATEMDIAGGRAAKREWSGAFEARGKIDADGWEGEARIAWAAIPLPPSGPHNIKVLVDWYVSFRQQTVSTHSTQGDFTKMDVVNDVDVPNVPVRHLLKVLPYANLGYDDENKKQIVNAGVDLKTEVTDETNLVMTVNPDFRNIENDILNLDFSNFERLPGESRPFFLEGSGFLLTGEINNRMLFASQRIGAFDTGLNFYGSLSPNTQIGALGIVSFDNDKSMVVSASHSPDPDDSFYGYMTALDRTGEQNVAGGLEYFKRTGDYLLFTGYQTTQDEVTKFGDALAYGFQYKARGLTDALIAEDVAPDFNPRIGFAPQTGYRGITNGTTWTVTQPRGSILDTTLHVAAIAQDKTSGGTYHDVGTVREDVAFRNGLNVTLVVAQEKFLTDYNRFYKAQLQMPRDDTFRGWTVAHTTGTVAGQPYENTAAQILYRPVKRLQLDLRHQFVQLGTYSEQTVFTMNWELDRYQSIGGRVVSQNSDVNWFVSYKLSGNLGNEYFLILGDPNATSFKKTLILKFTAPLNIDF